MARKVLIIDPNNHGKVLYDCLIDDMPISLNTVANITTYCDKHGYDVTFSTVPSKPQEVLLYMHDEDEDQLLDKVDPNKKLPENIRQKLLHPLYEIAVNVAVNPSTGEYDILWFSPDGGKTKYVKESA